MLYPKRSNYYMKKDRKIGLETIPSSVRNKIIISVIADNARI